MRVSKNTAWKSFITPLVNEQQIACALLKEVSSTSKNSEKINAIISELEAISEPIRKDIHQSIKKVLRVTLGETTLNRNKIENWLKKKK